MGLFHKKVRAPSGTRFDPEKYTPVIRCSICTGEMSAGFRNRETGKTEEIMLIRDEKDLEAFRQQYGIEGEIQKVY